MPRPVRAGGPVAGVLALHRLEIRSLQARVVGGSALLAVLAHPRFGSGPDRAVVHTDLRRALADPDWVGPLVARRAAAYPVPPHAQPPALAWVDDEVSQPVLEVRTPDGVGVLHQVAAAITAAGGTVRSARCQTLGAAVIDTFTVKPLSAARREAVSQSVLGALGALGVQG